uniref:DALR_1 domain-containing protein n=1 Tax=Globodera pallida TaxID=36090 RepID=A0A183CRG4_GLOPA
HKLIVLDNVRQTDLSFLQAAKQRRQLLGLSVGILGVALKIEVVDG